jgi:septum formation protein
MKTLEILLGSKSPRRQQLLKEMGFDYKLVFQDIEESYPEDLPVEQIAEYLALRKGEALKSKLEFSYQVILTSDTTVVCEGKSYEKPIDFEDAKRILLALSAKVHQVITAVSLISLGRKISFSEVTDVHFEEISEKEAEFYIENFKPYDKAGAYAIQEWIGVNKISKIDGSFYNVMGLPTTRLFKELKNFNNNQ